MVSTLRLSWVTSALECCAGFPTEARARLGCELVSLRRSGLSASWEHVRQAPGAASIGVRVVGEGSPPRLYRVICAVTIPKTFVVLHACASEWARGEWRLRRKDTSYVRARLLDVGLDRHERRTGDAARAHLTAAIENVFVQLGFGEPEATTLLRKSELIAELRCVLRRRGGASHVSPATRAVTEGSPESVSTDALMQLADSLRSGAA